MNGGMDVDTVLELLQSKEQPRMRTAARDLGRELAVTEASDLRPLRRRLGEIARDPGDAFAAGFVDALTAVTRGFEAEREDEQDEEAAVTAVRTRPHWLDVLELASRRDLRPKDVKHALDREASQVTTLLDEIEQAGLIVRREPGKTEDGRTRPFRLTARGRTILTRASAGRWVAPIGPVVEAVVRCVAQLVAHGRASKTNLDQILREKLDGPVAAAALQHLADSLAGTSMALVDRDDSIVAPSIELLSQLDRILEGSVDNPDAPLQRCLTQLSATDPMVVRVSNRGDEWDLLVNRSELKEAIQVVRGDDVSAGRARPATPVYQVLYESPLLLEQDRKREDMVSLIKGATNRFVFGMQPSPPPPAFTVIDLPSVTIRATD